MPTPGGAGLEACAPPSKRLGRHRMGAGWTWSQPVAFRMAAHSALPAPEIAGRQEVGQGHCFGDRYDLPSRIIDQLGEADDEPLLRGEGKSLGSVAVRDVLEEGLRVNRLAALPVDHRQDPGHARVEIQGARVAAELAVDGALDGEWLELYAPGPVLPALDRPDGGLREARLGPGVLAEPGTEVPLDASMDRCADGGGLLSLAVGG